MKVNYQNEIESCIRRGITTYEGNAEIWFVKVWELLERDGLTSYDTIPEKMQVYSLAAGMCTVYLEVTARLLEYDCADDLYLVPEPEQFAEVGSDEEAEILRDFIAKAVCNDKGMETVLDVLDRHLGVSRTFAAIYYCLNYEQFSLEDWETDEFYYGDIDDPDELEQARCSNEDYERRKELASCTDDRELLDMILNEVDVPKADAFEWLKQYMH